jgi:pimeloyl-ACP methyl ester carboxylesterase
VIYVHGFNVDQGRALKQWAELDGRLDKDPRRSRLQSGLFVWPSDVSRHRNLNKGTYPSVAASARYAGNMLGEYLFERSNPNVVLVGHSLGALVALAAANYTRQVRGIVLLGAAVYVSDMTLRGEFGFRPLAQAEAVGWSNVDKVLRDAFPLGERARRPFEPKSPAVGLTGEPADRWTYRRNCGYDVSHHKYYQVPASADIVRQVLRNRLGRRVAERMPASRAPLSRDDLA